jgi:hypothetical protein
MSIVLDGVTLGGSLQWTDQFTYTPVAQSTRRTLGGGLAIFSKALLAGRPITLTGTEDSGWITKAMLDSLVARAAVAGAVYSFNFHGQEFSVVFRHDDAPAVDFQPLQPKAVYSSGDYFTGTLKLLTV